MENPLNFSPEEGNLARNVKAAIVYTALFTGTLLKGCMARADNGDKFDSVLKDHVHILEKNHHKDSMNCPDVQWATHTLFTDDAGQEHVIPYADFFYPAATSIVYDSQKRVWELTAVSRSGRIRKITADQYIETESEYDPWFQHGKNREFGRRLTDSNTFQ